jgi:hypothetical protein
LKRELIKLLSIATRAAHHYNIEWQEQDLFSCCNDVTSWLLHEQYEEHSHPKDLSLLVTAFRESPQRA